MLNYSKAMTLFFYLLLVWISDSIYFSWGWFLMAVVFSIIESSKITDKSRQVEELEERVEELEGNLDNNNESNYDYTYDLEDDGK